MKKYNLYITAPDVYSGQRPPTFCGPDVSQFCQKEGLSPLASFQNESKKLYLKDGVQEQTGGVKFIRRKKVLFEYTSKTLTLEKRIYMTI